MLSKGPGEAALSACCLEEVRFLQVCTRAAPPEPKPEGRRRWWEDVQEERQSKPGAWALESQRLLSAKTGGAAGGDWGPTALSWGLEPKRALSGKKMMPRTAAPWPCPHPAHHLSWQEGPAQGESAAWL